MNKRRFQFRIVDLMLVTVIVALTVVTVKEDPMRGTAQSHILLLVLAGILGAVTGRFVSKAFYFGTVGGLLLGALGYFTAVFALSLGIRVADHTLVFVCVCVGGVVGGLIPMALRRLRHASLRIHMSLVLVGVGLLTLFAFRCWTVSEQTQAVAELRAAGAYVDYSDTNPLPTILDSRRMEVQSEWLLQLLGVRTIRSVILIENVDLPYVNQILIEKLPFVEDLRFYVDHIDDEVFELLNSGKLSKLDHLRFTGRGFDDASLSRLQPLAGLVLLDLHGTSVSDESIEYITSFPQLEYLVIGETNITAEGVTRLKAKIRRVYTDW